MDEAFVATRAAPTILIVEDSATQRANLQFLLEEAGFTVIAAVDGKAGLAAAQAHEIAVVVSDVVMPEMDGYGLCRALRNDPALRHLPVILLTSLTDPRDVVKGLESGANNFLCKPYDPRVLVSRVQNVLANQEIRRGSTSEMGISISFAGQRFFITADRLQILDLLLSTYENAVLHNTELIKAHDEVRQLNEQLESKVAERTAALTQEIVERKRAEAVAELAAREWQATFDAANDAFWLLDKDQRVVRSNKAADTVFDHPCGAVIGLPCWEVAHGKDCAIPNCPVMRSRKSLHRETEELTIGDRVYIVTGDPILNERGEFAGAVHIVSDVTERKRADAELNRLRKAIDTTHEAVFLTDPNGVFTFVNPGFTATYGHRAEDIIGKQTPRVLKSGLLDAADYERFWTRMLQGGEVRGGITNRRRDGTLISVEGSATPIRDDNGQVAGFLGIQHDVSDRKRAEQALLASEERHRTLFEGSSDAIMTVSPSTGRFTSANPATLEMFEVADLDAFLKLHPWELSPALQVDGESSRDKAVAMVEMAVATGSHLFDWTHRRLGGETFPATVLMSRTAIAGEVVVLATVRDVTPQVRATAEREKLKEQLRVAQKMEAIGSLAGGVAHDFNNLLCVILNNVGFALEGVPDDSPQKQDLLEIKHAGESAASLTRQLLAFSRKQMLQPVSLDLNEVTAGVEKMLRRVLREDIELVRVPSPDLGPTIADPGQIEQVLMNLVVNARDAMPAGGRLTIETANVDVSEQYTGQQNSLKAGPYVMLAVSDTGSGMDEETQARIFEPFFTTKEVGRGTGLGLSTVYGIVKQSGGGVWVYSEVGKGTAFKILLPRATLDAGEAVVPAAVAKRPSSGSETVLLVEDVDALRRVAARTLTSAGYTVLSAASGEAALQAASAFEGHIDLLLTDVVMPRMGGPALAERLLKVRPDVLVLYTSGYPDNAVVFQGLLSSQAHFLPKPFSPASLTTRVREVLDRGGAPGGAIPFRVKPIDVESLDEEAVWADVLALPEELVAKLHKAVGAARLDDVTALIAVVALTHPVLADHLTDLAHRFDYAGMRSVLRA
jgi:PAS domain S-box-containing protein